MMGLVTIIAAIRAWGPLAVARDGLAAIWRWLWANPARIFAALALAMAVLAYTQHRAATANAQKARAIQAGWDADRASAKLAKAQAEARYRSLAHDADQAHAADLAQGSAALAAYIAAHRVQPAPQANPARAAQGGNPAVPAIAPAQAIVAPVSVSEADLRTCDADYAYARAAYDWAKNLAKVAE